MARNEQQNKKGQRGGPQADPSNQTPKRASGGRDGGGGVAARGGNKVSQGRGSDTGNKGKR